MYDSKKVYERLQPIGLKPLNKIWAKAEILIGLACVFFGLIFVFAPSQSPFGPYPAIEKSFLDTKLAGFLMGLVLFVCGGYLAMAGHRSHIYRSNNLLTAFLADEIRKNNERETSA